MQPSPCGVFAYGSLTHPGEAGLLPATLSGFRRSWDVCTDNDTATAVRYLDPETGERPSLQVLFLNLTPDPHAVTAGLVLPVTPADLELLDRREGNYVRTEVTGQVSGAGLPSVIWTYLGRPDRVRRAQRAVAEGTAVIREDYLHTIREAFERHGWPVEVDPGIPVRRLRRIVA